ncbi:FAD/NAD-binding domain-containing protein [Fomitiporia mediterranea MF3/22]|uniref:FAD/NAD-binding domain-containing protein n=1 Tax=Fomitiporia mediterranea (strain MF3/22) TaxID=694068 RepID=UPI000440926E|nr:FAD/NAD-binding domain-containing protein [Fomitiporia mediterranea MF3/22]EJD04564.1 FAD/NAD-binding domain-containing protein [Fomitiporia mediterranea MF3/22]
MAGDAALTHAQRSLPTLDRLNAKVSGTVDTKGIASRWFLDFAKHVEDKNIAAITDLLVDFAFWRDMLALTWDFRSFEGTQLIKQFLQDVLVTSGLGNLQLKEDSIALQQPYHDILWITAIFTFETKVGRGSGVFRLVPTASGEWKAYIVYTNLEELKDFPERIGTRRNFIPNHGMWPEQRRREINFEDTEPAVVIIGGGQSGLEVAARLKLLDVPTLIVERQARVGDQWRGRYEALCLHDPVWYDHMPYIPFPLSWPVWSPAPKLADWLEFYANSMELNVWTSSTIENIQQNPSGKGWTVSVKRADGSIRVFNPRHIVFAHGFGGGVANLPKFPGMDEFEGRIVHSSKFKSARDNIGKKVVVIGACTSGHDIAHDHYTHGVDVTLYQRSSTYIMSNKEGMPRLMKDFYWEGCPPTDVADLLYHSQPNHLLRMIHMRVTKDIADADRELLEGLEKRGFRINFGDDGSGFLMKAWERGGGYYLDVGASQLIVDGKIKLKNDSQISRFSKHSIEFEDGSELPADVVIFATGYGDPKQLVGELVGKDVADRVNQVWGLNNEGEINSAWRWSGVQGLYFMMGNLALCRFHSRHLALYIKAQEAGLNVERYTK